MARKAMDQAGAWVFAVAAATGLFGSAGAGLYYLQQGQGAKMALAAKALPDSVATIDTTAESKPAVPEWAYEGDLGPANWGALHASWAACSTGQKQSPIDFQEVSLSPSPVPINFAYRTRSVNLERGRQGITIAYPTGSEATLDGTAFALEQVRLHTPSEHTVFGEHYPMEIQLLHRAADGRLMNLSLLVKGGAHNPALDPVWNNFRSEALKGQPIAAFNVGALLPESKQYYSYEGSLTSPPCTEGVNWLVMKAPIEASVEQLQEIAVILGKTARPVQPLVGRQTTLKGYSITDERHAGLAH